MENPWNFIPRASSKLTCSSRRSWRMRDGRSLTSTGIFLCCIFGRCGDRWRHTERGEGAWRSALMSGAGRRLLVSCGLQLRHDAEIARHPRPGASGLGTCDSVESAGELGAARLISPPNCQEYVDRILTIAERSGENRSL